MRFYEYGNCGVDPRRGQGEERVDALRLEL